MDIRPATTDAEPTWVDPTWKTLIWLNLLALPTCLLGIPLWGFVNAISYPVVPTKVDVIFMTLVSLLPFGLFLALAKEGGTQASLGLTAFANGLWLFLAASFLNKLMNSPGIESGGWLVIGLSPVALLNVVVVFIVFYAHRTRHSA